MAVSGGAHPARDGPAFDSIFIPWFSAVFFLAPRAEKIFEQAHFLMPIIARFILTANAAVFQTLLQEKGIPSTLLDSGSRIVGTNNAAFTVNVDVPDGHVEQALAVYADYSRDNKERADKTEFTHPNKGYPFFVVWMLLTMAIMLFYASLCLPSIRADADADTWRFFVGSMFLTGIFCGLAIACAIAFLRMIPFIFKRKASE
jgi:nitric oxide reductase large subunit